jgi:hypothetical protein
MHPVGHGPDASHAPLGFVDTLALLHAGKRCRPHTHPERAGRRQLDGLRPAPRRPSSRATCRNSAAMVPRLR